MNETMKPLIFCLDKSNNLNLKQIFENFSTRFFNDGKYLLKTIILNRKNECLPVAIILTGDFNSIQEILNDKDVHSMKTFIFCQNFTRQIYEPLIIDNGPSNNIMGLFTIADDLKTALENILMDKNHNQQLIRLITNNLDHYLWYEFLKHISYKIEDGSSKTQTSMKIFEINRKIEYDPLITWYTLCSTIRDYSQKIISNKKLFYGCVLKKKIIEQLQLNVNNLISFNSLIHHEAFDAKNDARHYALQNCSRLRDEVSVIFELESANHTVFKVIRVFNADEYLSLWVVQLIGTNECQKLSKQFIHTKYHSHPFDQYEMYPEILFGQILIQMNEIDKAYEYFFQTIPRKYDQLNYIHKRLNDLWKHDKKYNEVIDCIAKEFEKIESSRKINTNQQQEITYLESDFDSTWEPPVALNDTNKMNQLLPPISYRIDQILSHKPIVQQQSRKIRKNCTLF